MPSSRLARWLLACLLACFCSTAIASESRPRVIGYVMDGQTLPAIDATQLDVINFAFAHVNAAHEVFLPGDTAGRSLAALVALKQTNPDLRIVLSVGGWGAGNFSEATATEGARQRFADSAAELIRRHDLDGLDIDWEYPTLPGPGISHSPADRGNFSLMLEVSRARLDALGNAARRHYLLTIAAADGEAAQGLEIARITRSLDWINLMTYDFHGSLTPTTGHHAALWRSSFAAPDDRNTARAVQEFLDAGVPPRKLNIGVAFYGRMFTHVSPANHGLHQPYGEHAAFLSWRDIQQQYLGKQGFVRYWDEQAQAPYLWNERDRIFITYDDPQSLRAKASFVKARGLGGMMYWEHRQDDGSLLKALRDELFATPSTLPAE